MTPHVVALPGCAPFQLYVHQQGDRYISRQIRDHGYWEPFESALILRLLRPGDTFLDLGANIGYYTVLASLACGPNGKVYAFEPEPSNFALLLKNVALNRARNVTTINAAATAASGLIQLYLSPDNQGDHRTYGGDDRSCAIQVPGVALDDWFSRQDNRIDFVKMDTQGSEVKIIDGMLKLIEANHRHMRMVIEFWPFGLTAAGDSAEALADRLRKFDFILHKVDESLQHPMPTSWGELLAEAQSIYHPSTRHFTNLLLTPPA